MLPCRDLQDRNKTLLGKTAANVTDRLLSALDDQEGRTKDYFFRPGLILRWLMVMVYQSLPDRSSSWAYSVFPDVQFWRNALEQHGKDILKIVLNLTLP